MKFYLSLIIVVLFISNYQICELVYPNDLNKWWELRQNIYNVIIAISLYLAQSSTNNKNTQFILNMGIGIAIANCIDRIFFDINYFQINDIYTTLISLALSINKYYNGTNRCRNFKRKS